MKGVNIPCKVFQHDAFLIVLIAFSVHPSDSNEIIAAKVNLVHQMSLMQHLSIFFKLLALPLFMESRHKMYFAYRPLDDRREWCLDRDWSQHLS